MTSTISVLSLWNRPNKTPNWLILMFKGPRIVIIKRSENQCKSERNICEKESSKKRLTYSLKNAVDISNKIASYLNGQVFISNKAFRICFCDYLNFFSM